MGTPLLNISEPICSSQRQKVLFSGRAIWRSQGSILGPLFFNLYVNDIQRDLNCSCFQYADNTTLYEHRSPRNLIACENEMNGNTNFLEEWAKDSNPQLNEKKTKQMLITCNVIPSLTVKGQTLERVRTFKLLGTWLNENLK